MMMTQKATSTMGVVIQARKLMTMQLAYARTRCLIENHIIVTRVERDRERERQLRFTSIAPKIQH